VGIKGTHAGAAAAFVVATGLVLSAIPAQGAPMALPAGTTGTATPTPTPTPTTTTPTPTPPPDDRLLPDLVALRASDLRIQVLRNGQRRIRFSSSLGNKGKGPIEVRPNRSYPCPVGKHASTQVVYRDANKNGRYNRLIDTSVRRYKAGCMVYHPAHSHWHFEAAARYTLTKSGANRDVVVNARRKVSFCLRDIARLPASYGTWNYGSAYGACSKYSSQGISVGWMDVYRSYLAGQALLLPRNLPNGVYCLVTVVDPSNRLLESNNRNNGSVRALRIRGNSVTRAEQARCS
jgi:hypothetical protein